MHMFERDCSIGRLLSYLDAEPIETRHLKINPLDVLDLLDAGLVLCQPGDGKIILTDEGRRRIGL
jgi:hypothetical protein